MRLDKPLATGIIFLLIFLIGFFFVLPKYKQFKSVQLSFEEIKADFNAKYEYYANISDIYQKIQERKDDFSKIDDALPDSPNLGKLSYYFQTESKKSGLLLKDLTLSKLSSKENNAPAEIVFSLNLFGDYSSMMNFMISMEKSAKLFDVISISFKSSDSQLGAVSGDKLKSKGMFDFMLQVKTNSY